VTGLTSGTPYTFTRPARDVRFNACGVNDSGKVFTVRVHRSGQPVMELEIMGEGNGTVPLRVDLSALGDITRLELVALTDSYGVGWDDFTFSTLQ
jgi:hypothetical protein